MIFKSNQNQFKCHIIKHKKNTQKEWFYLFSYFIVFLWYLILIII
jgi:hypothetical protein